MSFFIAIFMQQKRFSFVFHNINRYGSLCQSIFPSCLMFWPSALTFSFCIEGLHFLFLSFKKGNTSRMRGGGGREGFSHLSNRSLGKYLRDKTMATMSAGHFWPSLLVKLHHTLLAPLPHSRRGGVLVVLVLGEWGNAWITSGRGDTITLHSLSSLFKPRHLSDFRLKSLDWTPPLFSFFPPPPLPPPSPKLFSCQRVMPPASVFPTSLPEHCNCQLFSLSVQLRFSHKTFGRTRIGTAGIRSEKWRIKNERQSHTKKAFTVTVPFPWPNFYGPFLKYLQLKNIVCLVFQWRDIFDSVTKEIIEVSLYNLNY